MVTIAHLTTVHPRSDTRVLIKEAVTLATSMPHKVLLIVADGKGNTKEEQGRVSIHDLGRLDGGRLRRAFVGPWRAFFAICRIRPKIVHFHDPELIPLGVLLRLFGYMVIYDVHEDVPRQILSKHWLPGIIRKPVAWIMSAVEWFGAKAFNAIVPATQKIANRFPVSKTVTIYNYPIVSEISQPSPIPYIDRPKWFVYPGVIATIRGGVEMVRVFELLGDIPDARLELAGTSSPDGFVDTLQKLPGWSAVNYHGEISRKQLADILGSARAGLVLHHPVPNEVDCLPIKMFEYMAAGLPVIASDFPAWRRIIESADCGLLVDPLNLSSIAEAMRWILEHPKEAETMGQRGREAVEHTYNWDTEASKIKELYSKLLDA